MGRLSLPRVAVEATRNPQLRVCAPTSAIAREFVSRMDEVAPALVGVHTWEPVIKGGEVKERFSMPDLRLIISRAEEAGQDVVFVNPTQSVLSTLDTYIEKWGEPESWQLRIWTVTMESDHART